MLYDIANLNARMCIVWKLDFIVILLSDRGTSYISLFPLCKLLYQLVWNLT